jgi:regulator of cell morphogenesis and NO signaling
VNSTRSAPVDPAGLSLGDLVVTYQAAATVLDGYGLDYCCHGEHLFGDACTAKGLEPDAILSEIMGAGSRPDIAWTSLPPAALVAHIIATHHAYLHAELAPLTALADKVLAVHGRRHPELARVHDLVHELRTDLEPHLRHEEEILFPAIVAAGSGCLDHVADLVDALRAEHDAVGRLLLDLRVASAGYAVPADGCASYRSLYERLAALELDTHVHVHKENHVLFPAAVELYGDGVGRQVR